MNFTIPVLLLLSAVFLESIYATYGAHNDCFPDGYACYASGCKKCEAEYHLKVPFCRWRCKKSIAPPKWVIAVIAIACLIIVAITACFTVCLCCPSCYCAKTILERHNPIEADGETTSITTEPTPNSHNYGTTELSAPPPYPGEAPPPYPGPMGDSTEDTTGTDDLLPTPEPAEIASTIDASLPPSPTAKTGMAIMKVHLSTDQ